MHSRRAFSQLEARIPRTDRSDDHGIHCDPLVPLKQELAYWLIFGSLVFMSDAQGLSAILKWAAYVENDGFFPSRYDKVRAKIGVVHWSILMDDGEFL